MKKDFVKSLKTTSVVCLIAALVVLGMGIYKVTVYENPDSIFSSSVNAYVGGDAYNYIINGTYFSGYMALGGALLVCSTVAKGASIICDCLPEENYSTNNQSGAEDAELPEI